MGDAYWSSGAPERPGSGRRSPRPARRPAKGPRFPTDLGPHRFDPHPDIPADFRNRLVCCRCNLLGQPGDAHHPVDASPQLLPEVPPAAREVGSRILGEGRDG